MTFYEINSPSLAYLMKSSTFGPGLKWFRVENLIILTSKSKVHFPCTGSSLMQILERREKTRKTTKNINKTTTTTMTSKGF